MNNQSPSDIMAEQISHRSSSPPLARLTLRVGITGHRPNNLHFADADLLRRQIQTVVTFLKATSDALHFKAGSLYLSVSPLLRVISPLAEGSDRLVVEVANTLGEEFDLQCVLPFSKEEYEQDFNTPESRAQFRELFDRASSVLELDGSREPPDCRDRSYEALGRVVLNHSDVMIAIWDGEHGQRGGTSHIVNDAELLSIPLVWINSRAPHAISVKMNQGNEWIPWAKGADLLPEKLAILFLPPSVMGSSKGAREKRKPDLREAYFSETERRWKFGSLWKLFRNLIAVKVAGNSDDSDPAAILPQQVTSQIEYALGDHYLWADQLADYYAGVYRSAFIFNYLMSACAVLFAFLGHWFGLNEHGGAAGLIFILAEVMILLAIILVTFFGMGRKWHERWIDYRLLAEHLRQMRFLMALGRPTVSVPRFPLSTSGDDPRASWMYWHLQALVRHSGIIRVKFEGGYLKTVRNFLHEGIRGQVNYHERNAKIIESLNHRLRDLGIGLFFLAFAAALLHLLDHQLHLFIHRPTLGLVLTVLTIVGPSFGAALAAIRGQGEFERLVKGSRAMSSQLEALSRNLAAISLGDKDLSSVRLGELAVESAQVMVKDVLNWRLVVEEKPLDLPA